MAAVKRGTFGHWGEHLKWENLHFWLGYGFEEFVFLHVRTRSRRVEAVGVDRDGSRHHGNVGLAGRRRRVADDVIAVRRWRDHVRLLLVRDVIGCVTAASGTGEQPALWHDLFARFLFVCFFLFSVKKVKMIYEKRT